MLWQFGRRTSVRAKINNFDDVTGMSACKMLIDVVKEV